MTWTTQRPQVEGWYWWRRVWCDDEVVYTFKGRRFWHVRGYGRLSKLTGEWSSTPIAPPGENKEDV